jgi:hypothetical protein
VRAPERDVLDEGPGGGGVERRVVRLVRRAVSIWAKGRYLVASLLFLPFRWASGEVSRMGVSPDASSRGLCCGCGGGEGDG